jgi:hypothetical protein
MSLNFLPNPWCWKAWINHQFGGGNPFGNSNDRQKKKKLCGFSSIIGSLLRIFYKKYIWKVLVDVTFTKII